MRRQPAPPPKETPPTRTDAQEDGAVRPNDPAILVDEGSQGLTLHMVHPCCKHVKEKLVIPTSGLLVTGLILIAIAMAGAGEGEQAMLAFVYAARRVLSKN